MDVPRGGNAHFKESVYELHKRESHGFSPSVSHRLDHEVSLQGAGRRVAGADTNDYPPDVQRTGRPDRIRRFVARTCPYVRAWTVDTPAGRAAGRTFGLSSTNGSNPAMRRRGPHLSDALRRDKDAAGHVAA